MIRTLQKADINSVADIWLDTNIKTHNFIPAQYWKDNFETVKTMLSQADVYVYENSNKIEGSGLTEEQTEMIFETNSFFSDKDDEVVRVDDIMETVNRFKLFDFIFPLYYVFQNS